MAELGWEMLGRVRKQHPKSPHSWSIQVWQCLWVLKCRDAQTHPVISQLREVTYIQSSAGIPAQITGLCIQPCIPPALSISSKLLRVGAGDLLLPGASGEASSVMQGTGSQFPVG